MTDQPEPCRRCLGAKTYEGDDCRTCSATGLHTPPARTRCQQHGAPQVTERPDQQQAIRQAITDLEWCTKQPHDIDRISTLSAKRWPRTRWEHGATTDQMANDIKAEADDYGDAIGYGDPTGEAVADGRRGPVYATSRIDPGRAKGRRVDRPWRRCCCRGSAAYFRAECP